MRTRTTSKPKLSRTESDRIWKERNADRNQRVGLFLPKTAYNVWMKAGDKSGVSMAGLMLATLDFLDEAEGKLLLELAKRNGRRHGHRVQFVDPTTDQIRRVQTGRYNKGKPDE